VARKEDDDGGKKRKRGRLTEGRKDDNRQQIGGKERRKDKEEMRQNKTRLVKGCTQGVFWCLAWPLSLFLISGSRNGEQVLLVML
jgi:hypothetical protein